ncbi:hydroxysteroid 11-beta-dehydrogenase 1-like protein [Lytechinus variegatus]|uniref:hydroxysteroid 11-beta-dehydrogenase 1-like protein n=1 Tax=Lytechinus variegatus TaxID=7654 RepID=UPI001BB10F11|nr:hydroxysteroid 11-beta-dehydrogenase 1-like protein [Lytechinus variegatus]
MSFSKILMIATVGAVLVALIIRDNFDPASIKGKRAIVTGASTGIGEQIAYWYCKLGARVLVTARREAVLQKVVEKCKDLGAEEAFYMPLDMGRLNDTEALVKEAEKRFGGLDFLILNHIYSNYLHLWGIDEIDRLQKIMDVNFRAYVSLATYSTPMLAESKGSIGVVSSVAGLISVPLYPSYSASKFALHGFFGSLRHDYYFQHMDISITEHIIGPINTTNAVKFSKGVYEPSMFSTTSVDTAYRIIEGTAMRERMVFFPRWVQPITMVRDLIPRFVENMMRARITDDAIENMKKIPNT